MLRFYVVCCSLSWYVVIFECSIGDFFCGIGDGFSVFCCVGRYVLGDVQRF